MNILCLFAKNPEVGSVKTRLGNDIGMESACRVYTAFLQDLITTHRDQSYRLVIFATTAVSFSVPKIDLKNIAVEEQSKGNLGDRLSDAFSRLCASGDNVCIIGADTPHLSPETVEHAFTALEKKDVVLGPTTDGGYYLIGMSKHLDIFDGVEWSSEKTFHDTQFNITNKNKSCFLLTTDFDVDTANELPLLVEKDNIPCTHHVLESLHDIRHHPHTQ